MDGIKLDTLFYELELHTTGFGAQIDQTKAKLGEMAKFIKENPTIAAVGLAAGFASIAIEAVKMAGQVDTAMRQIQAAIPATTAQLDNLRNSIRLISLETPHAQQELAATAAEIAKMGNENPDDIAAKLKGAVDLADAASIDLGTAARGVASVGDAFGLTGDQAVEASKRIFAATNGHLGLDDVFNVIEHGGSVLKQFGVTADQAGQALATLVSSGLQSKAAGTALLDIVQLPIQLQQRYATATDEQRQASDKVFEAFSRTNVAAKGVTGAIADLSRAFGGSSQSLTQLGLSAQGVNAVLRIQAKALSDTRTEAQKTADAQTAVQKAADTTRDSVDHLSDQVKNNLTKVMIDLGNKALPGVNSFFKDLIALIDPATDKATRLADAMDRLGKGQNATTRTRILGFKQSDIEQISSAFLDQGAPVLSGLDLSQLRTLQATLATDVQSTIPGEYKLKGALDDLIVSKEKDAKASDDQRKAADAATIAANKAADAHDKAVRAQQVAAQTAKETAGSIRALGDAMQQAIAGTTVSAVDNAVLTLKHFREQLDEIEKKTGKNSLSVQPAEAVLKQLNDPKSGLVASAQAKVDADAQAQLDKLLADADSKVAAVKQLYDGLIKDFTEKKADPPIIAQLEKARDKAVAAAKAMDDVNAALSGVESNIQGREIGLATGTPIGDMSALLDQLDQQNAALKQSKEHSVEWSNILDEIKRTTADIKALQDGVTKATQDTTAADQAAKTARAQYVDSLHNDFNEALQGAEQVAASFGKIDQNTQAVLNGISDWGNALSAFAKGDIVAGTIDAISGTVNVVKGAFGIHGKSQAQKDAERMLDQNTQAILKLNEHIGQINNVTATGSELSVFQQVLNRTDITGGTKLHAQQQTYRIQDFLEANGLTIGQFRDFAASLGVNLSDAITGEEFKQLQDQAKKILPQAGQYADTFEGQMAALQQTIKVFDIEDPTKQLKAFGDALTKIKGGGGALTNLLNGFDLTTTAGVDAATQAVQALFTKSQNSTLSVADLGGLSASDFQNALGQIADYLQSVKTGQTQASGTGGYNQQTTITDVTGMRLAALFSTGNVFAERTAQNTAIMAAILSGGPLPSIAPPSIPAGGFGSTSTVALSGNVGVTLTLVGGASGLSASDTAAIQDAVNAAVSQALRDPSNIRVISQGINSDNAWAARSSGELMQ